ncbi:hypothetical protein MMC30_002300 [Trapelia coarctata]|nr:hypothetical protein [Trapelia coarctata]
MEWLGEEEGVVLNKGDAECEAVARRGGGGIQQCRREMKKQSRKGGGSGILQWGSGWRCKRKKRSREEMVRLSRRGGGNQQWRHEMRERSQKEEELVLGNGNQKKEAAARRGGGSEQWRCGTTMQNEEVIAGRGGKDSGVDQKRWRQAAMAMRGEESIADEEVMGTSNSDAS